MQVLAYALCFITSLFCAALLLRAYLRTRTALLLWSGICFVGLAIDHALLIVDATGLSTMDLSIVRAISALIGTMLLIYGLIWKTN